MEAMLSELAMSIIWKSFRESLRLAGSKTPL